MCPLQVSLGNMQTTTLYCTQPNFHQNGCSQQWYLHECLLCHSSDKWIMVQKAHCCKAMMSSLQTSQIYVFLCHWQWLNEYMLCYMCECQNTTTLLLLYDLLQPSAMWCNALSRWISQVDPLRCYHHQDHIGGTFSLQCHLSLPGSVW